MVEDKPYTFFLKPTKIRNPTTQATWDIYDHEKRPVFDELFVIQTNKNLTNAQTKKAIIGD